MKRSRRGFLAALGAMAAGSLAAGSLLEGCAASGPAVYRYAPSGKIIDLFLAWYPELIRTGGAVELILTGSERSVLVVRTGIDRFAAVSPVCPDGGCRLELRENSFYCPCERTRYGFDGQPIGDASKRPLESYRTEFRDTSLRIFLG